MGSTPQCITHSFAISTTTRHRDWLRLSTRIASHVPLERNLEGGAPTEVICIEPFPEARLTWLTCR